MNDRHSADELTLAQVMLPEDANPRGNIHGGTLMKLADTAGGVCATRYAHRRVVTAVVDSMTFEAPVFVGNLVVLHAAVTWTGRTSLETRVTINAEDALSGQVRRISTAFFVYVAVDDEGRPSPVPPLDVTSEVQRQDWLDAEQRRELRLRRRAVGRGAD
jgi:acyl-CoA hydrolase